MAAPSIWQVDTNALVRVVFPTPGSPSTATMRGSRRRTWSHASYKKANSRSRPISVSASKRRSRRSETRSEEHTSELQSRLHLVCRLLLEKKKNKKDGISDDARSHAYV